VLSSASSKPLVPPKILEPRRRQLGVAHRMLDVLVTQVGLQRASIVASIGKRVPASVTEHARMGLEDSLPALPARSISLSRGRCLTACVKISRALSRLLSAYSMRFANHLSAMLK
jgi:hypothetical protein